MAIKTLYTAVGRFERRTNGCNRSCPIILLGGQEYMADMQEMVIWSMLNWRILRWDDIAQEYEKLATASVLPFHPSIKYVAPMSARCNRSASLLRSKILPMKALPPFTAVSQPPMWARIAKISSGSRRMKF